MSARETQAHEGRPPRDPPLHRRRRGPALYGRKGPRPDLRASLRRDRPPDRVAVVLRDGRKVFRKPLNFASRKPYDAAEEREFAVPACEGDAALPHATLVEEGRAKWAPPKPKPEAKT